MLESHYRSLLDRRDYEAVRGGVGPLGAEFCHHRFCLTDDADVLAGVTPSDSIVSVGISMTGAPHVGTLGQIQTAVELERAGFAVQLVLADLVVATGRGTELGTVRTLAERYGSFARERGFEDSRGRVQIQSEALEVLRTAFVVAGTYDPAVGEGQADVEPTAFDADLATAYEAVGVDRASPRFSRNLETLLLAADTLHPLLEDRWERVALVLGADNAGLSRTIDAIRRRAAMDGRVVGLYTRLVGGIDGTPKMSKSIPGSAIRLDEAPERVRSSVVELASSDDRSARSIVFQMMRLASPYSPARLTELRDAAADGTPEWTDAAREYATYVATAAREWDRTAEP